MSSRIKVVKRSDRETLARANMVSLPPESEKSEMIKTVKGWISTTRERREAEMRIALRFRRALEIITPAPAASLAVVAAQIVRAPVNDLEAERCPQVI